MKRVSGAALLLVCNLAAADWQYTSNIDQMTSKTATFATLESNKSLDLGFPYNGSNFATLTVRQHPKFGLDVILDVQKGQILCSSYAGCPISIRFDDAPPITFGGTESGDHDSKVVFLGNEKKFIVLASKAKRILAQVNMYQNGAPVMEFYSSSPLTWGQTKVAPSSKK